MKGQLQKYLVFGALAGAFTTVLLRWISMLVSNIPGLTVDLQSVSVSGQISGAVSTGMGVYLQKLLGILPWEFSLPALLITAAGGAAAAGLGYWVSDATGLLAKMKTKTTKTATVLVVGSLAAGVLVSMQLNIPALTALVIMAVDALVLSYVLVKVDETMKLGIVP